MWSSPETLIRNKDKYQSSCPVIDEVIMYYYQVRLSKTVVVNTFIDMSYCEKTSQCYKLNPVIPMWGLYCRKLYLRVPNKPACE